MGKSDRYPRGCFTLHDVAGDGHCFYRSVWRLLERASHDVKAAVGLMTRRNNNNNSKATKKKVNVDRGEDAGVQALRASVARAMCNNRRARTAAKNLVELGREVGPDLVECYPVLRFATTTTGTLSETVRRMAQAVQSTRLFASELELEAVREMLQRANVDLLVVTMSACGDLEALGDRWLRDLSCAVGLLGRGTTHVGILVNVDNIHYQYLRLHGQALLDRRRLAALLKQRMEE